MSCSFLLFLKRYIPTFDSSGDCDALERDKADVIFTNLGEVLTLSGTSSKAVIHPTSETLGILRGSDMAIAASSGKITYIGKSADLNEVVDSSSALEVDCKKKLVVPGFIDSHTHAIFAGSREEELNLKLSGHSYLEILGMGGGILKTVKETRNATQEDLVKQTKDRLDRMVSLGTTTFEIKSGYGLTVKDEIRLLETISFLRNNKEYDIEPTLLSAHAIPQEYSHSVNSYVEEVVKPTINITSDRSLARFCDVFLEKGVFGVKEARRILEYGKAKGLLPKLHADEFSDLGGAQLSAEVSAVTADHLLKSSPEGIGHLARSGVISVLLPGTSLSSFAGNYANAREIINRGGAVALGTDLSPNSWIESMQFVISLACYGMKMTPTEAIVAATINSAHAIDRARDVGSIEVGKSCDLLVLNLRNHEELPYRIGSSNILNVVKKGKVLRDTQS